MLDGKVILVTHVRHFVGLPAAKAMAAAGAIVLCHDASFAEDEARRAFAEEHSELQVTPEQEPEALVHAALSADDRLDVLVNNDAFPARRAPIEEADADHLRAALEALLVAPFRLSAAAVPSMKARGAGKILFVTSAAPLRGLANYSIYASARGAANSLVVSLARELAPHNIQVNALAPNYVESPTYFPPELLADAKTRARILGNVPLGRLGRPEEAGATLAFLASDAADFMTGLVLPFAGGWA